MAPETLFFAVGFVLAMALTAIYFLLRERKLVKSSVERSRSAIKGRVWEQMSPMLPGFRHSPADARFLGTPVDYVVFDGHSEGSVKKIVFLEVKKNGSLSRMEKSVREAILNKSIEYEEI